MKGLGCYATWSLRRVDVWLGGGLAGGSTWEERWVGKEGCLATGCRVVGL